MTDFEHFEIDATHDEMREVARGRFPFWTLIMYRAKAGLGRLLERGV